MVAVAVVVGKILIFIIFILCIIIACALIFRNLYIYFIFTNYLKKSHPLVWQKLVKHGKPIYAMGCPDRTEEMERFRKNLDENYGDEKLLKMKIFSEKLFNIPMSVLLIILLIGVFFTFNIMIYLFISGKIIPNLFSADIYYHLFTNLINIIFSLSISLDYKIFKKIGTIFTGLILFAYFFILLRFIPINFNKKIIFLTIGFLLYNILLFNIYIALLDKKIFKNKFLGNGLFLSAIVFFVTIIFQTIFSIRYLNISINELFPLNFILGSDLASLSILFFILSMKYENKFFRWNFYGLILISFFQLAVWNLYNSINFICGFYSVLIPFFIIGMPLIYSDIKRVYIMVKGSSLIK